MEANTQILDTLLEAIINACTGNGSLEGYARSLFGYLIAIDFVWQYYSICLVLALSPS